MKNAADYPQTARDRESRVRPPRRSNTSKLIAQTALIFTVLKTNQEERTRCARPTYSAL